MVMLRANSLNNDRSKMYAWNDEMNSEHVSPSLFQKLALFKLRTVAS